MAEFGLPTSEQLAQLFRASEISLDEDTADFEMRRTFPILVYVDGPDQDQVEQFAEDFRGKIEELLRSRRYPKSGQWGPITGSDFTTIFGTGDHAELGGSLTAHLRDICRAVIELKESVPPQITLIVVVGTLVLHVAGPIILSKLPVATIPIKVFEYIANIHHGVDIVEAVRAVLFPKPRFDRRGGPKAFKL